MKRKRNLELASIYRQMRCVVCQTNMHVSGDHIKSFASGGECCHENMWALCHHHHIEKHTLPLSEFVERYPQVRKHLENKGWEICDFTRKWIRLTKEGWDEGEKL